MSKEQRERFDRDGYLIVPGLSTDEVGAYAEALDRVVATAKQAGELAPTGRSTG
jgi:ectoine hydroxylase